MNCSRNPFEGRQAAVVGGAVAGGETVSLVRLVRRDRFWRRPLRNAARSMHCQRWLLILAICFAGNQPAWAAPILQDSSQQATNVQSELTADQWQQIRTAERQRIAAINQVVHSVVAVYDEDRQGGGSAVIIDPSGIAVTNHHVVAGAGVRGWGGLADGELYPWELIGTDPGGDVAVIQLSGRDSFPWSPLGNSDFVQVGQWAMAMGNPFVLTEDQYPTVTLGIVSGIERYQSGAGQNMLVYGNCIQIDSSINPGNSGGPLFNLQGQVIGINGRGSFLDRGRVNVGLGYAISANQVKNFLPDLLASKIIEHGTLDASFSDYAGVVRCSSLNEYSPVAKAGLKLGDELLEFENLPIRSANQFTNLICTLPIGWPAKLVVRTGQEPPRSIHVRLLGLPYQLQAAARPDMPQPQPEQPQPEQPPQGKSPDLPDTPQPPAQPANEKRQKELNEFLSKPANSIRDAAINRRNWEWLMRTWQTSRPARPTESAETEVIVLQDQLTASDGTTGSATTRLSRDGTWQVVWTLGPEQVTIAFDGQQTWRETAGERELMTAVQVKLEPLATQALAMLAANTSHSFTSFGEPALDGSDKSQQRAAWRLKWTDADDDKFYAWLSVASNDNQRPEVQLLKVAPDLNGSKQPHVVLFSDWRWEQGWWLPGERKVVREWEAGEAWRLTLQSTSGAADQSPALSAAATRLKLLSISTSRRLGDPRYTSAMNSKPDQPTLNTSSPTESGSPVSVAKQTSGTVNDDPFLQPLLVQTQPKMVKVFGAGAGRVEAYATGLLVSADGLIVTTQGVFLDGQQVRVVLADGQTHSAVVLKRDRTWQLALLKINLETPQHFDLNADVRAQSGDWVLALSNAFKVADKDEPLSVTLGIISLTSSIDARLNERDVAYRGDLIVLDAITSNPGAAGGAVVDLQGNLVGVIGRIINSSETNTRLNYAVPRELVKQFVVGEAIASVEPTNTTKTALADLGIKLFELGGKRNPAYIDRVVPDSPAAKAGLKTDDLVISLGGDKIGTIRDYAQALDKLVPGQETIVVIKRGTEVLRVPITPVERIP